MTLLFATTLPGSSVVEQVTVNHLVVGSIPTRAAILANDLHSLAFLRPNPLGHFLATFEILFWTTKYDQLFAMVNDATNGDALGHVPANAISRRID